jgi:FkbM family methyltransferase
MKFSSRVENYLINGMSEGKTPNTENIFLSKSPITLVIYGAGNTGKRINLLIQQFPHIHVFAFLDRAAKSVQNISGIPVYRPENFKLNANDLESVYVLIAIHNPKDSVSQITRYLKDMGFIKILNLIDFYNLYPYEIERSYWLTKSKKYIRYRHKIIQCSDIWEDGQSKSLFASLLENRFFGDYDILPEPDTINQYFPRELSGWKQPLNLVDCGAYIGDTLRHVINIGLDIKSYIAFEPDIENYKILSDYIGQQNKTNYQIWRLGVYSRTKKIGFTSKGTEASKISKTNRNQISVIRLDDMLGGLFPNYIKMDIEGAEIQALKGAKYTITRCRPGLAICIYHHPMHLWQIPLMIQEWNLNYKFYLRSHAYNEFDTVMYGFSA